MAFTVNDFQDLLRIIETQPGWRQQLKRALFPDLDLEKSFQEMNAAITRLAAGQELLRQDVSVLKQDVSVLKQDVSVLKQDVKILKTDIKDLKGRSQEDFYRQRMGAVFSQFLRKGSEAVDWVGDLLHEKVNEGVITAVEMRQVMAADLLWSAETRTDKRRVVIALEASWLAEETDLERALTRATILRKAGLDAFAMVGGHEWKDALKARAWQANIITTSNGRLYDESWLKAIQSL
jgi:hypothetical protein